MAGVAGVAKRPTVGLCDHGAAAVPTAYSWCLHCHHHQPERVAGCRPSPCVAVRHIPAQQRPEQLTNQVAGGNYSPY